MVITCLALLFSLAFIISITDMSANSNGKTNGLFPDPLAEISTTSIVNDTGTTTYEDIVINDSMFVIDTARVNLENVTVNGNIRVDNQAQLYVNNCTINGSLIASGTSNVTVYNRTVIDTLFGEETSTTYIQNSTVSTIWARNTKELTIFFTYVTGTMEIIEDSQVTQLLEWGVQGILTIDNSTINQLDILGSSQVLITGSTILILNDNSLPFVQISSPLSYGDYVPSTGDRSVNLTWSAYDSPIIDGYLNISFDIFIDGNYFTTINGSGYYDVYNGSIFIEVAAGNHEFTINGTDAYGNTFEATASIEVVNYAIFPLVSFLIVLLIITGAIVGAYLFIRHKRKHETIITMDKIISNTFNDKKWSSIIILGINILPGLFIFISDFTMGFLTAAFQGQSSTLLSIDTHRTSVATVFSGLWLIYYPMIIAIMLGAFMMPGLKNGTLSWFLSKPIRRWEYFWGRVLPTILVLAIGSAVSGLSIALSGLPFFLTRWTYWVDIFSIGGYCFLIGFFTTLAMLSLTIIGSIIFNMAIGIIIPIVLSQVSVLFSFLPLLTRSELPLIVSYPNFYYNKMTLAWIQKDFDIFGIKSMEMLLPWKIIEVPLDPYLSMLVLAVVSLTCLFATQYYVQRKNLT